LFPRDAEDEGTPAMPNKEGHRICIDFISTNTVSVRVLWFQFSKSFFSILFQSNTAFVPFDAAECFSILHGGNEILSKGAGMKSFHSSTAICGNNLSRSLRRLFYRSLEYLFSAGYA
jgi:hypothetical protein